MADADLLHTTEILKAALPYVDVRTKTTMDLLVKLYEFMDSFRRIRRNRLITCDYEDQKADVEAMLNSIRPLCKDKERAMVDQLLGFYQAKRMYTMYNSYMSAIKTMQEFGEFSSGGEGEAADSFMNQFAGVDFSSFFSGSSDGSFGSSSDTSFGDDFGNGSDSSSDFSFGKSEASDSEDTSTGYDKDHAPEDRENVEEMRSDPPADGKDKGSNSQMFDALKHMIPPDQQSTFENLRMLFQTMSYDDNKKNNTG